MPKGPFFPSEFVPTQFSTAADKADFGNALSRFLESDCPRELFTAKLYARLSMTFGHIAHGDIEGFYSIWFTSHRRRLEFIRKTLRWPCHGDPKFTFSDVEQAIQRVVKERNDLARFELRAAEALRVEEMNELRRLEAKFRISLECESTARPPSIEGGTSTDDNARSTLTIQMKLF